MSVRVRLGQRYQDLDPRRPDRVGTVVQVRRFSVRLRWNTGHTTTVSRRMLDAPGSRGYVLIEEPRGPARRPRQRPRPTTARDCRAGWDDQGRRRWRCLVCGRSGVLRPPWRVLLWTQGRWEERSTVVCSDDCHRVIRAEGGHGRT